MAWAWFLGIGGVGAPFYLLVPRGLPQDVVYQLYGIAAVVAILVGVHWYRPARRWPWYLMAAGQAIWSLADAVGSVDVDILGNDRFPSPADPVYLVGYVVIGASLLMLIRGRGGDLGGLLDSAIFTVSTAVLAWVLLAGPTIRWNQGSTYAAATAAAYPLFDIVLAGLLIRLITTRGGRTRAFRLLVYAILALVLADAWSTASDMTALSTSEAFEPLWLLSYVAWGAAALEKSMVSLTEIDQARRTPLSRTRLALLTVAVLVPPALLGVQYLRGSDLAVWAVVLGSITISLLVMARMSVGISQITAATRARELAQGALAHQAVHDSLTGLPNRAQVMGLIRGALNRAQRSGSVIGLLFVDLDGFKQVNDALGHDAGDEVLQAVGQRMQACVRTGDIVGRLGGDEFVVLLEPLEEEAAAAVAVAERVIDTIAQPLVLRRGREVIIGGSIGVAIAQGAQIDPDRLVNEADVAVYRAKIGGRGRVEVFDRSLRDELDRRAALERALSAATRAGDLTLRHDPIVDLGTRDVVGYEAQVAWARPGADELMRSEVLPVAARTDLICDLDAWVLREAAAQVAAVAPPERAQLLAVAVSGRHLLGGRLVGDVTSAFDAAGLDLGVLLLLVHESDLIDHPDVLDRLDRLRRLGARVCVDGFGANEGPTSRWGRLPVDLVRIEPTRLSGGTLSATLLRLTVETAHTFGWGVIAGGVADPELLPALAEAGCEFAQGPMSRRRRLAAARNPP